MTDVKVEQCDRDAAGSLARFLGESEAHIARIINGEMDHTDIVIAFARHRQAAEKATRERDAGIAQAEADDIRNSGLSRDAWQQGRMIMADVIATAIRSQNDG